MTISRIHGRQVRTGTLSQAHLDTAFQAVLAGLQSNVQSIYDTMSTDQERIDAIAAVTAAWGAADSDLQAAITLLVNAAKSGAGLEADGSFVPPELSNYIGDATSLKGAVVALDNELKALADAVAAHATTIFEVHGPQIVSQEAADADAALRMDGIDAAVAANAQVEQANADAIAAIQGGFSSSLAVLYRKEVPAGVADGVNVRFVLSKPLIEGSEGIHLNGVLLDPDSDYFIVDSEDGPAGVQFTTFDLVDPPQAGDRLLCIGISSQVGAVLSLLGESWEFVTELPLPWGATLVRNATFFGGKFIISSIIGRYASSDNGLEWSVNQYTSGSMSFSPTGFVVGDVLLSTGVNGHVATSPDGINWTYQAGLRSVGVTALITSGTWGNGMFVVGTQVGGVATSPDGINWTASAGVSALPEWGASAVSSIVFNGNVFVASGNDARIATSPDGINWTYQAGLKNTAMGDIIQLAPGMTSPANVGLLYLGNEIVAVAQQGRLAKSTDGVSWDYYNNLQSAYIDAGINLDDIRVLAIRLIYTGEKYFGVTSRGLVFESSDFLSWRYLENEDLASLFFNSSIGVQSVAYNGNVLVAVGATSTNGTAIAITSGS